MKIYSELYLIRLIQEILDKLLIGQVQDYGNLDIRQVMVEQVLQLL